MNALRIAASYLLFGAAWILFSDQVVGLAAGSVGHLTEIQSAKGIFFVVVSAILIYALVRVAERSRSRLEEQTQRQRDFLANLLDVAPSAIYSLRPSSTRPGDWEAEFVSHTIEPLTGYTVDQWLADPDFWIRHVHPDDVAAVREAQTRLEHDGQLHHEYRFRHADGSYRWVLDHVVLRRDGQGRPAALVGAWMDVTARHQADEHARLIARVFDLSQEGIFITDAQTRFISVNRAFTQVTGYGADEAIGRKPSLLKSGRQDARFYSEMWARINAEGFWEGEIWNRRKSGEIYPEWLTVSAIRDAQGKVQLYLGIFTETSGRKAAEARIQRLANYDSLTGLPNRALLTDRAKVAIAVAHVQRTPVVVMHLNVDHFGTVNESFGHQAGDQVLCELSRRFCELIKPDDTLCRIGGDDFVLLLPGSTVEDIAPLTARLLAAVDEPLPVSGQMLRLTASIGVAVFPLNGSDLVELMRAAESAVHQAKRQGRNGVSVFSREHQDRVLQALVLASDLRWALERGQLHLHYQPQVDVRDGRIVGVEALLRWQHPQLGAVSPARFIPVAEEIGLIREIGAWVIDEATRQNAAWRAAGLPIVPMAVNLSVVQFRDPGLIASLTRTLEQHGLPPDLLELELTESVAMEDSDFTIETIAALKQLGFGLSIDDFGTGYSSLAYLRRFAIDKLKIDQSFVRGVTRNAQDEALVTTVINLAANLGLRTIAEGVETRAQLDFLKQQGCLEVQGYLFGRPMPAEQFEAVLRTGHCRPHE